MAQVEPFFGWGSGSGPGALMGYVSEGIRPVTDPHNFLIRSWISWGIPGVTILAAFLFLWIKKVFMPLLWNNPKMAPAGFVGCTFGGLAFLMHSLIDMDFFVPETAMFGWAVLGICFVPMVDSGRKDSGSLAVSGTSGLRFLGGVALILVLPTLVYTQSEFTGFRAVRDLEAGRALQSADHFLEARRLLPFHGRFTLEEGRSRLGAGQLEEAVYLFEQASDLIPHSPYPWWEMGRIALEQGEWEQAIIHLEQALKRYPTSPRIRLDLAQAHNQMGRYEETVKFLQEVVRYAVFDPEARAAAQKAFGPSKPQAAREPIQAH